jgi:hypothetical protein
MAGIADPVFFKLVRDFLKVYLPLQKNCSPHTIRAYQTGLEQFFDFVKEKKRIRLARSVFSCPGREDGQRLPGLGGNSAWMQHCNKEASVEKHQVFLQVCRVNGFNGDSGSGRFVQNPGKEGVKATGCRFHERERG